MAKQNLMWTALPNGLDTNGNLRVSAMLSPRLTPDADQILKPFTDMLDWPKTVQAARFTIHFGPQTVVIRGSETTAPAKLDAALAVADSSVWTALFHPNTFVAGYVFQDHVGTSVLSYDTVAVHSLAQNAECAKQIEQEELSMLAPSLPSKSPPTRARLTSSPHMPVAWQS